MKKIFAALIAFGTSIAFGATTVPVQLINPTGSTSGQAIVSTGASSAPGWGNPTATLGAQAANTVVANFTGSPANPAAFSVPSCSTSTSALQYTSGTGFTCGGSGFAALTGAVFTGFTSFTTSNATQTIQVKDTGSNGANVALVGNGSTTPSKFIRVNSGSLQVINDSYSGIIFTLTDAGVLSTTGGITSSPISGSTGSFTTLAASSTVSGTGFSNYLASPPAIGSTTPAAITGSVVNTTSNFQGPAAGYSISTVTGLSSGGGIQLFDGTHGSNVNITNAGFAIANITSTGVAVTGVVSATGLISPTSTVGIKGTVTNDSPAAGSVGENPTNATTGTSMTSSSATNCTSQSLTAGNWMVGGVVTFAPSAAPAQLVAGISTSSATLGSLGSFQSLVTSFTSASSQAIYAPVQFLKLASTTTVYLIGQATFGSGTTTCSGNIYALRIR